MDEEFYRTILNNVIERVSWLENEVRELRQSLICSKAFGKTNRYTLAYPLPC